MQEQIKAPEKIQLSNEEIANLRYTVQNTGNQDAHRINLVWSQNRGKSEDYEKWNKGKCTGNQQLQEGDQRGIKGRKWDNCNSIISKI